MTVMIPSALLSLVKHLLIDCAFPGLAGQEFSKGFHWHSVECLSCSWTCQGREYLALPWAAGRRRSCTQRATRGLSCTRAGAMPQYVHIDAWPGGIAVVLLRREPVNLMDLAMWQQLLAALDQLEADEVLRSSPSLPVHVEGIERAG